MFNWEKDADGVVVLTMDDPNQGANTMNDLFMTSLLIAAIVALAPLAGAEAGLREGRAAYAKGDYTTALEEILPLAEAGNADAQRLLGVMYRQGQGVAKDAERALYWTQQGRRTR